MTRGVFSTGIGKDAARLAVLFASFPLLYYGGVYGVEWCAVAGTALALCSAFACMRGGPRGRRRGSERPTDGVPRDEPAR